ncbi:MAG: enoyl-CoA hydratase/isomerase family protein [Burkholderiales bacterium]|nr:enoyl-CoA hydratase/isomerase family protein [Burkholderiales bacterium]
MVARLNRPEKKNAQSEAMLDLLAQALRDANENPEVGCFVLTGTGDAFCSGGDLGRRAQEQEHVDPTPLERKLRLQQVSHKVAKAVEQFEKPLIAAVNGPAVGAGMDMALMCDIRVASRSARFSEGYIRVGLLPGNGGCYFLPRLVGLSRALELLWTGDFVSAEEALQMGLVSHVHPDEELMERTLELARRIAKGPPVQVRDIKKLTYQGLRTDLATALDSVSAHMAVAQSTEDYKEAIRAFKEKRAPVFKGK